MSDRLTDEQVARMAGIARTMVGPANVAVMLAREVQSQRKMLDAIDALPDDSPFDPRYSPMYLHGYREAMRTVKRILHPEEEPTPAPCPKCGGEGVVGGKTGFSYDVAWTCPACGGDGILHPEGEPT